MKKLNFVKEIIYTEEQVKEAVDLVAWKIDLYYGNKLKSRGIHGTDFQIVSVLNGGLNFTKKLMSKMGDIKSAPIPILVSSYSGIEPMDSISVKFSSFDDEETLKKNIKGKHILIIDDILDSGRTLDAVEKTIRKYDPVDVQICVLLERRIERKFDIRPMFSAFILCGKDYVVGCGLDMDGWWRDLPYIASVKKEKDEVWDPKIRKTSKLTICNKCGKLCNHVLDGDISDIYGLADVSVDGGYFSKELRDGEEYKFDLCEKCVCALMRSFIIPAEKIDHGI